MHWCLPLWIGLVAPGLADGDENRFETKIRPTLVNVCFSCHGGKKTGAGLRVDSREALLKGGDSGPAIVPGEPAGSLLVQAIRRSHESIKMPPGKPLDSGLVDEFERWVASGAVWPKGSPGFKSMKHWAFEPVVRPRVPDGAAASPIDRFIDAGLAASGLTPVEAADRRTLFRRLHFDLIGLPPASEETEAFLRDRSPDAYEKRVDRLLSSPLYGERAGRRWLDLARYADTAGDNADYPVPELALYRDYVIKSFNDDKPYDRFVREQIAGDVLAKAGPEEEYAERVVATGFLALARRYATGPYELWHLTLEDAVDTTGRVFLGMTLRCARCHDHKFDPIGQKDYYAIYGAFAGAKFPYAGSEEFQSMNKPREGFAPLVPPARAEAALKAHRGRVAGVEVELKEADAALKKAEGAAKSSAKERLDKARSAFAKLARAGLPPEVPGAYAVSDSTPVDAPIQRKGEPGDHGPVVPRGAPGFLTSLPPPKAAPDSSGRRELADWLTRPENPLTARVMVNRVWGWRFGRGLVATPSNFGTRGEAPTHPALLDHLTARFIDDGWSVKSLDRLIVTSEAYRRSSRDDPSNAAKDPSNRRLWRFDRARLDAEALRDAMLATSGRLRLGKPPAHPFPPISAWNWTQHNPFKESYPSDHRSVYLMVQRLRRHPYLSLFDAPDANVTTDVRSRTTVPSQTLYLMNNPFVTENARLLAARLTGGPADRIERALALAWNRPPTGEEAERFASYVRAHADESRRAGASAEAADRDAWTSFARIVLASNEFLYVD